MGKQKKGKNELEESVMNNAMRTKTPLSKERKRRKWKKKIYDEEKNLFVEACSMRGREGREE